MPLRFSDFAKSPQSGFYLAIAGLVLSLISLVVGIVPILKGENVSRQLEWIVLVCIILQPIMLFVMYRLFLANFEEAALADARRTEVENKNAINFRKGPADRGSRSTTRKSPA
jgi:hypothetical protein